MLPSSLSVRLENNGWLVKTDSGRFSWSLPHAWAREDWLARKKSREAVVLKDFSDVVNAERHCEPDVSTIIGLMILEITAQRFWRLTRGEGNDELQNTCDGKAHNILLMVVLLFTNFETTWGFNEKLGQAAVSPGLVLGLSSKSGWMEYQGYSASCR